MAVAREIRPKKVLERVPLHANFPARTDYDVDFTCSDTCFHKFLMQTEFIDDDYDNDLAPIWTIDWWDQTSVYYYLQQSWEDQIYGRIPYYLPTFMPFYETRESKYSYELRCPDSKFTFYWDIDIFTREIYEPVWLSNDIFYFVFLDRTALIQNDRLCQTCTD